MSLHEKLLYPILAYHVRSSFGFVCNCTISSYLQHLSLNIRQACFAFLEIIDYLIFSKYSPLSTRQFVFVVLFPLVQNRFFSEIIFYQIWSIQTIPLSVIVEILAATLSSSCGAYSFRLLAISIFLNFEAGRFVSVLVPYCCTLSLAQLIGGCISLFVSHNMA